MKSTIPGPKPLPVLGNMTNVSASKFSQNLLSISQDYKDTGIYRLVLPSSTMLIVGSHDLVDELCDETRFEKRITHLMDEIRKITGDGLFSAHGDSLEWEKAHRLLMPAFGPIAIRNLFPQMLDIAEQMVLKFERVGEEAVFDVSEEMTKLTLDTIALCGFNFRFNSFYSDDLHPFVDAMVSFLTEMMKRQTSFPIQTKLRIKDNIQYEANSRFLKEVGDEIVKRRKEAKGDKEYNDLLNVMLCGVDPISGERLSDENIRDQMITFLIAGHETTSGTLSFAIYELLENPDILKKAEEEVKRVLGNRMPTIEDIPKLTYIDQILKETLRLHPAVPLISLFPIESTTLGGKYEVDKDTSLNLLTPWLHRDKKVWGAHAEKFEPDNFSLENIEQRPENCYKPFGNGKRACIGRFFAIQEAVLALAMLLQRFELIKADPSYKLIMQEAATVKPSGFKIRLKRKENVVIQYGREKEVLKTTVEDNNKNSKNAKPLHILFGSNTGLSKSFAQKIHQKAYRYGYKPILAAMDDYVEKLDKAIPLIIVTASYEGKPPNNAVKFINWLNSLPNDRFDGLQYAVLGCGHRDWAKTYQAIPKQVCQLLSNLGGQSIVKRGEVDGSGDIYGMFDEWHDNLWDKMPKEDEALNGFSIKISNQRPETLEQKILQQGVIIQNKELVNMEHPLGRSKRHIEIELPAEMSYKTGDYLSILPSNPTKNVERLFRRLGYNVDTHITIQNTAAEAAHLPVNQPISLVDVFTNYVELAQPATHKQVKLLVEKCPCPPEKNALKKYTEAAVYQQEILGKRVSVLDLLERYASIEISLEALLQMLPPIKTRLYSIASSPYADRQKVALTVSVLDVPAWSGQGKHQGVASNYLANQSVGGRVHVHTQPAIGGFQLPSDLSVPVIMVGAGSGIAPFRGFIQERSIQKQQGKNVGKMLLFFGCDHPEVDALYREELNQWKAEGIVDVYIAYSALPENDIKFVQHRLWSERSRVYHLLQLGAKFMVCGDGKYMAPAVRETCIKIYQEGANVSLEEAQKWLEEVEHIENRYVVDVFI